MKTIIKPFAIIICSIIICGTIALSPNIYFLITDKDYYGFPAVTQCRVCDKTVWEWQSYERREFKIADESFIVSNTPFVFCNITGSGLVHKSCKGNPIVN